MFLRDIHEGYLSLKDTNDEQIKFPNKLESIDKSIKFIEKKFFLSNIGLSFTARVKILNNLTNRLLRTKTRTGIKNSIRIRIRTGIKTGTKA